MRPEDRPRGDSDRPDATAVALDQVAGGHLDGNGVHWTLEESSELNVNLVHLDAGAQIDSHRNTAVDVVIVVLNGAGRLVVDGTTDALDVHTLAHVPKGAERSIHADGDGITYLTAHRRRERLNVGTKPGQVE